LANIKVIRTGINVSKISKQLKKYPEDWNAQQKIEGSGSLLDRGYVDFPIGVLQLVIGGVEKAEDFVGDTEICIATPAYEKHTEIISFMKRHFHDHKRCGFLSLQVGGLVGMHIDVGSYYQTKDRYHLSIQGTYNYVCGEEGEEEVITVEPGTLFWFNNKFPHGAENIGNCTRVTFVFDVPHHPNNPK
jgi:hypothetical protein